MFEFAKKKEKEREILIQLIQEIGTLKAQIAYLDEIVMEQKNKLHYLEGNIDTVHDEYTQIKGMIYTGRI